MERKLNILLILSAVILLFVILTYIVSLNGLGVVDYSQSEAFVPRGGGVPETVLRNNNVGTPRVGPGGTVTGTTGPTDQQIIADWICEARARAGGCSGKNATGYCKLANTLRNDFLDGKEVCCNGVKSEPCN